MALPGASAGVNQRVSRPSGWDLVAGGHPLRERRIAQHRVTLVNQLRRLLLGDVAGRLPRNCMVTLQEWLWHPDVAAHVADRIPLRDADVVRYPFPAEYPPEYRRSRAFQSRDLFRLRDVLVGPASGVTWLPSGRVLQESVGSVGRLLDWGRALHEPLMRHERLRIGRPVVRSPEMAYGDWLLEHLPNVVRARDIAPDVVVLMRSGAPRYMIEAIELLGLEIRRTDRPQRVEDLVFVPAEPAAVFPHPGDVAVLQRAFVRDQPVTGRAIYVSRRNSPKRRMLREDELETRLAERGVEIVYAERLTFREEVDLFASAELIIGPHGSGLTNVVWRRPHCRVLEIHPAPTVRFGDVIARLTVQAGHDYDAVTCSGDGQGRSVIPVEAVLERLG